MASTYPISLRKYVRLYALFPPLLTYILYGAEALTPDGVGFCIIIIVIMHLFYHVRVRKYFVVVVGDESLQLFDLLGHKQEIAYADLVGPLERNFGIIRYYTFVSAKNPAQSLVLTNYTEHIEQCLTEISEHISRVSR